MIGGGRRSKPPLYSSQLVHFAGWGEALFQYSYYTTENIEVDMTKKLRGLEREFLDMVSEFDEAMNLDQLVTEWMEHNDVRGKLTGAVRALLADFAERGLVVCDGDNSTSITNTGHLTLAHSHDS